jgi:phosphoribosyl-dephospho-CoA transferase
VSRGSDGKNKTAMEDSVSPEEVRRIDEWVRARDDKWTFQCLSRAFKKLSSTLGQPGKIKKSDTIETLATRMVSMVDTVCGLYGWNERQIKKAECILEEVVKERALVDKALAARFEIKLLKIMGKK